MRTLTILALALALVLSGPALAKAEELNPLTPLSVVEKPADADYASLGLSGVNKPEGMMYRLRAGVTPSLPPSTPRSLLGCDLILADGLPEGYLALYKGPYKAGSANCDFQAALYSPQGMELWRIDLGDLLSRPSHLEIQDMRYADGRLLYNEACVTYSSEAQGLCSSLVSLDPVSRREQWRTGPLVSNNIFLVHGDRIYAGYGFTSEDDYLHVLDLGTGALLSRTLLDSAHEYLEVRGDTLVVVTHARVYTFPLP